MIVQFFISIFLILSAHQASATMCKTLLKSETHQRKLTSKNFKNEVVYINHNGLKVPYVDLLPKGLPNGKTVFLVSGFSKNMRSWLPHMRLLTEQGYRVLAFDQTNVGYNLLENGVQKLDRGTGLDADSDLSLAVLKAAGVFENLIVLGHSRGAAVGSRLALQALENGIAIDQLLLLTPYVRYVWSAQSIAEAYGESIYDTFAEVYPEYYGQFLYDKSKNKNYEEIPELSTGLEEAALVYVLKGVKPNGEAERTTGDVLNRILAKKSEIDIQAFAAEHDKKLAPPELVSELERSGVDYSLLKGKTKDHYWPLHYAESMLKAVGLL